MFHNRTFKVLSNLALLVVLFTGQAAAAPNNSANMMDEDSSLLASSTSVNEDSALPIELAQQAEPIAPEETIRISGIAGGDNPSISLDGRYIAFESAGEVFVHDLLAGTNTLIGAGEDPYISAMGRYTVFIQGNGIFVWDMEEETEEEATKFVANGSEPSISADGHYVAFYSSGNVFVRDLLEGSTDRVSVLPNPDDELYQTFFPGNISADGRYVVFSSSGNGVNTGDPTDRESKVYVRDLINHITKSIVGGSWYHDNSHISMNGRYVTYNQWWDGGHGDGIYLGGYYDIYTNTATTTFTYTYPDSSGDSPISADGRYIAYTDNGYNGAYVFDVEKNLRTEISIALDGTHGNGGSSDVSISANGQYVVFTSTSTNLVEGDTNGVKDVFVRGIVPKPPLILVHGFQGVAFTGDWGNGTLSATGYHCSNDGNGANDIQAYNGSNSTLNSGDGSLDLADWFVEQGFEVWIAHLESSPQGTPGLDKNAKCLRDQIKYVASLNSFPITIVAHSMGGLVTRAAVQTLDSSVDIDTIYTLGSPHAGIPSEVLRSMLPFLNEICTGVLDLDQPAVCEMAPDKVKPFNDRNKNLSNIKYTFIGGDGGSGFFDGYLKLLLQGPNDGLVGQYSAVGWQSPYDTFVPNNWPSASLPGQYYTDETHPNKSNPAKAYYVAQDDQGYSDSYLCIKALMLGLPLSQDNCSVATPTTQNLEEVGAVYLEIKNAHLNAGQSVTIPFVMDGNNPAQFFLNWSAGNTGPTFTVTTPYDQTIDPAYVATHSADVSYEIGEGSPESSPYATYRFIAGQMGTWQLNITATDAVDYQVFGLLESSNRILTASTDLDTYQIGDTATIIATLENGKVGLPGAIVTATLSHSDGMIDTLNLTDPENDGTYTAIYIIPDAPGFMPIDVTASGNDNGTPYTRQESLIVNIVPNDLHLIGNYADIPNDGNADGFYEYLDFTVDVNADSASEYAVSAELYAGDQLITHAADYYSLTAGIQTITLRFDGNAIREKGLDGPYTIKNLFATSLDIGIPAISIQDTAVYTTGAYTYTQFGAHPCYILTLAHDGVGTDPTAVPTKSKGCYVNEYEPGALISLSALPAANVNVNSWAGTIANSSKSTTNMALMPANPHVVVVNYASLVNENDPWNTFLGGSGGDNGYEITSDGNGNFYVMGISDASWGNPIRAYSGSRDVFVAKIDSSGALIWNTFLGGSGWETYGTHDLSVDALGNVYVSGYGDSTWGNPLQPYSGGAEVFVAKLNSSGALVWNTFLGGSGEDASAGLIVDGSQNVYVSGDSSATWGNPLQDYAFSLDGFVAKLDSGGMLVWNTFTGGSGAEINFGITLDGSNNVYISGSSTAAWGNPLHVHSMGMDDAHVAKLDSSGALIWNTFLGGTGSDILYDIAVGEDGDLYLTGKSVAAWGDPILAYSAGQDGLAVKLDSSGTLVWNTFFGGSGTDYGYSILLDEDGNVNIAGVSNAGWGNPLRAYTIGSNPSDPNTNFDAIFVKLNSSGGLMANTFLGGSELDKGYGIALDEGGNIYIAGYSNATWDDPLRVYTSGYDSFIAKFNLDAVPLVVSSITRNDANPTSAASVDFTVNFSKPVTGVNISDFELTTTGGVSGANVTGVSGSDNSYTVSVNRGNSDGTIRLDVLDDATITDIASNPLIVGFTSGQTYTISTPPTVLSSVRAGANPTNATSMDFTVTLSEPVIGVDVTDFSLTTSGVSGATVNGVSGSGSSYTVTVSTGTGNGTIRLNIVDDDSIMDAVSNPLGGSGTSNDFTSGETYTIDKTVPVVISSVRVSANLTNATSVDFTVTFSEPITSVDAGDFSLTTSGVSGATVSGVSGSSSIYTVTVNTGTGNGTIRLNALDDDTIKDAANNPLGGAGAGNGSFTNGEVYTVDKTAPTVVSSLRANPSPTAATNVNFTVTFSESVSSVDASDFSLTTSSGVSAATVSGVNGSNNIYTVTVNTGTGNGTIRLDVVDDDTIKDTANNPLGGAGAGNGSFTSGQVYTVDKTAPVVESIGPRTAPLPTNATSIALTVVFSETVTGVNIGDFSLTTSGLPGATVTSVSGSDRTYTVTFTTGTGDGTIRLNVVDDDSIKDSANNPLGGAGAGNGNFTNGPTYTVDKTPPTVISSLRAEPNPINAASIKFTVTFSEPVKGVNTGDFSLTTSGVSGATISGISSAGSMYGDSIYTITVNTGTGNGTIRLNVVDDDSIKDIVNNLLGGTGAGNGNFTTGQVYTVDRTIPAVVSSLRANSNPTGAASVNFTVTFSESVSGVTADDFSLTTSGVSGATISGLSGSSSSYTVTVSSGTGNGTIRLNVVDNDSIMDATSNPLGGIGTNNDFTSGEAYTIDKTAPVVISSIRANPSPTAAASINFTVTFSESVVGVNTSDFNLTSSGVSGATISGVSGSGSIYTVTVSSGTGNGTIRLNMIDDDSIKDAANNSLGGEGAGNGNFTNGPIYTIDKIAPAVVSILNIDPSPTAATLIRFRVTFSESVTGVINKNVFSLTTSGVSGATVISMNGSGSSYIVTVSSGTGNGTIRLNVVDDDTIKDTANNPLGGAGAGNGNFTNGETYTVIK